MRTPSRLRLLAVTVGLAAAAVIAAPATSSAQDAPRAGLFLCQSSLLKLSSQSWTQANPPLNPCADDFRALDRQDISVSIFRLQTSLIDVRTDQTPDVLTASPPAANDLAFASARVASIRLTGTSIGTIEFGAVHADATTTCVPGDGGLVPTFASRSTIATLRINGTPVLNLTGPVNIPLSFGTLRLNQTETTSTGLVRRGAVWDTPLFDVILAEAKVSVSGNPCRA
ncbi:choice-of-anchor P family protein [Umezawaea endophytica]|uniref:Uncharacterized protein n=1 Tax=Umezawaea endophytica TaxID=1654476 RepID=A0A9X2VXA2_9PSEU|nr:choice-of-anchor P family protein [Umezawaea endophytica]MCS7484092.1 hypothetical protein [Umezawaea endophytica]